MPEKKTTDGRPDTVAATGKMLQYPRILQQHPGILQQNSSHKKKEKEKKENILLTLLSQKEGMKKKGVKERK